MAVLASDGLSLSVGDGGTTELFTVLRGVQVNKLEITQELADSQAVTSDAWQVGVAIANRRVKLAFDGLMTDEAAARRIRAVTLSGAPVNIKLALGASETLSFSVYVTNYLETIQAGAVKRFACELDSSGSVVIS